MLLRPDEAYVAELVPAHSYLLRQSVGPIQVARRDERLKQTKMRRVSFVEPGQKTIDDAEPRLGADAKVGRAGAGNQTARVLVAATFEGAQHRGSHRQSS